MNHTTYEVALIRRDQLLRDAADRRLVATASASRVEHEGGGTAIRLLRGLWRSGHEYVNVIAKVREVRE